jgi:hypothetical protein
VLRSSFVLFLFLCQISGPGTFFSFRGAQTGSDNNRSGKLGGYPPEPSSFPVSQEPLNNSPGTVTSFRKPQHVVKLHGKISIDWGVASQAWDYSEFPLSIYRLWKVSGQGPVIRRGNQFPL